MTQEKMVLVATSTNGLPTQHLSVTSIDDAKAKLDRLNANGDFYTGQIEVTDETGETTIWEDDEFSISDLHEYYEALEENGGYDSHAEFAESMDDFHDHLDGLFSRLDNE